ncbi:unnamed protein product [Cylicocyclus nassatus]|uniref:Uncharacterized protein n=1 Tax=Cylicocyclus nassatus TaxID=53992 RepID=A0AA36GP33_CYLNA|nr:unnamed protein product [Cylicocyclus nassatus]
MCSKGISIAIALLVILQVHGTTSCTFIDQKDDFVADVIYAMLKKDKDWCLLTCYEEENCTYVEYQEGVCTIFKDGETHQDGGNNMYKLDCQLTLPACPHCLPLAPEVEFQTLPVPKIEQSKTRMRELLAKDAVALTVVHIYDKNGYIFTKSEAAFPDGTAPFHR